MFSICWPLSCCGWCQSQPNPDVSPDLSKNKAKDLLYETLHKPNIEINKNMSPKKYKVSPNGKYKTFAEVMNEYGYDYENRVQVRDGKFSRVYKIEHLIQQSKDNKTIVKRKWVAIKCIDMKGADEIDRTKYKYFVNEISIMLSLKDKNVVSILDNFIINNMCYLFMPLADKSLEDFINETKSGLTEIKAKKYFIQIANGVFCLHKHNIAHRDIKPANVLIFIEGNKKVIKLADFGLSKILNERSKFKDREARGTLVYMSPQMLKLDQFSKLEANQLRQLTKAVGKVKNVDPIKADIWSLAVCLYYMMSLSYPFMFDTKEDPSLKDVIKVVKKQYNRDYNALKDPVCDLKYLNDLIDLMLDPFSKDRIEIRDVLNNKWLKGVPNFMTINE